MKLNFNNRKAVVTGAGRGIGKAIAEKLAQEGVSVLCVSKTEASCHSVAEQICSKGGKAYAYAVDVSQADAVLDLSKRILVEHGNIDILINNAGITRDGLMLRMSVQQWESVINTNLSSCFYWVKGVLPSMVQNRWGRVINISSVVGLMGNAGQVNYGAAKAGMIGFTKCLAREVGSRHITVNVVAPGFITTEMTESLGPDIMNQAQKTIPLKRFGTPEEVAVMVTYLASEEAGNITGSVFSIDGGLGM